MARSKQAPVLGPLEQEVMRIVWAQKESNVNGVLQQLRQRGNNLAYTTVMTTMARLATKGLLSRRRAGRFYVYRVRVDEETFRQQTAHDLAQRLVHGFDSLAIASFVEEVAKVGPMRLKELQDLVREAAKKK